MSTTAFFISVDPNNETISYMRQHLLTGKQLREMFEKNDIEELKKVVPQQYFKPLLAEWEKAHGRQPSEQSEAHGKQKEGFDIVNQRVRIPQELMGIQTTAQTMLQSPQLNQMEYPPDAVSGCVNNGDIIHRDILHGDDTNINRMVRQRHAQARTQTDDIDARKTDYLQTVRSAVSLAPKLTKETTIYRSRVPTLYKNKYYDQVVRNLYNNQHDFNL